MRATIVAYALVLAACIYSGNDSDFATLDVGWSFRDISNDVPACPQSFSSILLSSETPVAERAFCDDLFDLDKPSAEQDVLDTFALNDNNTVCFYDEGRVKIVGDKGTVEVPSLDSNCGHNATCPGHIAAMNPLYQLSLELVGDSLSHCSFLANINVVELLNSNGVLRRPPSGNHVEGSSFVAFADSIRPSTNASVLIPPTPNPTAFNLWNGGYRLGVSFRTIGSSAPLVRPAVEPPPGDYFIFAQVLKGPLPEHDPVNYYQYAFVFDADGNTSNNYQPLAQYPADFFKDTDRWYELLYTPSAGWTTKASTAINSQIRPAQTGAQIYAVGSVIMLLVPKSEFSVANPSFRMTAFRHKGDYGQNPPYDFDGYVDPPVADGLHTFTETL